MFYMPQYHNLSDGRQVFLRFPDPQRDGEALAALGCPVHTAEELAACNTDPARLVAVAECDRAVAGAGLLQLQEETAVGTVTAQDDALRQLLIEALNGVALQKGLPGAEIGK